MEKIKKIKCIKLWTDLMFLPDGEAYTCCPRWIKKSVGNIKEQTIKQIWNGSIIKVMRRKMLNNNWQDICAKECPYIAKNNVEYLDKIKYKKVSKGIIQNKTVALSLPINYQLANWSLCNLKCIMCTSGNGKRKNPEKKPVYTKKMIDDILRNLDDCRDIILSTNGDPFVRPDCMNLMAEHDLKIKYPKLRFSIYTNGILFNLFNWNKIKHNNFNFVDVSIDAATKKTYEKIRVGGKWEILMNNLEFIKSLKDKGIIRKMYINFCIMKSNYKEIPQFVELGKKLNVNQIYFMKLISDGIEKENIFKSKTDLVELKKIIDNIPAEDKKITDFAI